MASHTKPIDRSQPTTHCEKPKQQGRGMAMFSMCPGAVNQQQDLPVRQRTYRSTTLTVRVTKRKEMISEEQRPLKRSKSAMAPSSEVATAKSLTAGTRPSTTVSAYDTVPNFRLNQLRGLVNTQASCFANSVLHLFNASISPKDLAEMMQKPRQTHTFGFDAERCLAYNIRATGRRRSPALRNAATWLRNSLKRVAENGKVALLPHFSQLLTDLRKEGDRPTAFMLQQVFAHASASDMLEHMDGDSMQDSVEYFTQLLNRLTEEHPKLGELFEVKRAQKISCRAHDCQHSHEKHESEMQLTVNVRNDDAGRSIQTLIEHSKKATELSDYTCQDCKAVNTSVSESVFGQMPRNLMVVLNRVPNPNEKVTAAVRLDFGDVQFGDSPKYRLVAMVRHGSRGRKTEGGHYTAFQKHQGRWFHLDDEEVVEVKESNMADSHRHGQSAMLLFKKIEAE